MPKIITNASDLWLKIMLDDALKDPRWSRFSIMFVVCAPWSYGSNNQDGLGVHIGPTTGEEVPWFGAVRDGAEGIVVIDVVTGLVRITMKG